MKAFYPLLLFFNLVCFALFAQQNVPHADSLRRLISLALKAEKTPSITNISRINDLADDYFESHPDSTLYYGNLEIQLSKKINYSKGIADGTYQIATVYTLRGQYDISAKNYSTALNIYKQINDAHRIDQSYMGLGSIEDYLGNYSKALDYYNIALKAAVKAKRDTDIADCYNYMGVTYDNKGDFSEALDCYFKSLIIDVKYNNELDEADKYCNIGVIMQEVEYYPKALEYFNHALAIWKKHKDKQGLSTIYQNIGEVLMAQKKYSEAYGYLNKASDIFHEMNDSDGLSLLYYDLGLYYYYARHPAQSIDYLNRSVQSATQSKIKYNKANAYTGLALVYNLQKDYSQAYAYAIKAQSTADKLGSLSIKANATLQVSNALAGLQRYEQAYTQHQLYTNLKDSLNTNESIQKLIFYNLEMDFSAKQKQIADEQHKRMNFYRDNLIRQKNTNYIYAVVILIMAILAFVYYRAQQKQQRINHLLDEKNKEITQHQENLNSQAVKLNELNLLKDRLIGVLAHDMRAPISTLRGLFNLMIDDGISREEFVEMIPKVFNTLEHSSDFLDTLLFWINSQVDSSESAVKNFAIEELVNREITHLEDQLNSKDLKVVKNIDPGLSAFADPNSTRIVIHNFLTNAIKFSHRDGIIEIIATAQNDGQVLFIVKDNGVGMPEKQLNNLFKNQVTSSAGTESEIGTGMGLLFCKDLVEKCKGKIWANSKLGTGTELCFVLPIGK